MHLICIAKPSLNVAKRAVVKENIDFKLSIYTRTITFEKIRCKRAINARIPFKHSAVQGLHCPLFWCKHIRQESVCLL